MAIDSMEHEGTAADMNPIPKAGWHLAAKNGPICFSPLSISEDVLAEVRNCREVRQANRALRHLGTLDAASMGFKGEFRQWEQPASDRRLITGGYRDLISDVPADPAARDRMFYRRESFGCEKTRSLFRPLAEK